MLIVDGCMKKNLFTAIYIILIATIAFTSCSSDEPKYVDQEAHEKTMQLKEQYGPLVVGTWHVEYIKEKGRFFERLTFNADGTFTGMRKWQTRKLVTIDGEQYYTDWQDFYDYNGTFTGTWKLSWERDADGVGSNKLWLSASYDGERDWTSANAYSLNARFITANDSTLSFTGGYVTNGDSGETVYKRGEKEPSF